MSASDAPRDATGILFHLSLSAVECAARDEAVFHILNNTIKLIPYERAALWLGTGKKLRLAGISGLADTDTDTPLARNWSRLLAHLSDPARPGLLQPGENGLPAGGSLWEDVGGDPVLWIPLVGTRGFLGGLWLRRSSETPWSDDEAAALGTLARAYAAALERHAPPRLVGALLRWRTIIAAMILIALIVVASIAKPLRVVAPCEVIALDPRIVAAPLDGVIREIAVRPGETVKQGQVLFQYEDEIALRELEVARQQVKIIESQIERATVMALQDESTQAELRVLRDELNREKARLQLSMHTVEHLKVTAPADGTVQMTDPNEWPGRLVRVGQKVMTLVDPARTQVRIWIAESDRLDAIETAPVRVVLDTAPETALTAKIDFIANAVQTSPRGQPSFLAEAKWEAEQPVLLGQQGTVVLYGPEKPLGYHLARRPLLWLRRLLGY